MLDEGTQSAIILRGYRQARLEFGLNRIKLGAHLHLIKDHKLWKGVAESWEEFLAVENVNPNAARQYINVARKFVYELDLDEDTLRKLGMAGISALEKASKVINESNQDEIIATLTSLSERDAIQRILEIASLSGDGTGDQPVTPTLRVLKVLREYHELPPDMQQDFRERLTNSEKSRRARHEGDGTSAPIVALSNRAAKINEKSFPSPSERSAKVRIGAIFRKKT